MKAAIQYQNCLWEKNIPETMYEKGFSRIEIPFNDIDEYERRTQQYENRDNVPKVSGIIVSGKELDEDILFQALSKADELEAFYVVIQTEELSSLKKIEETVEICADFIREQKIEIYLENGFGLDTNGEYQCNECSEINELKKMTGYLKRICDHECFGISINVGNANVLAKNLRKMIEEAGNELRLIHINDNNGFKKDNQMPFTFTRGRGSNTTDWYRLVAELIKIKYDGWFVFDAGGLFERMPSELYPSALSLMKSILNEWKEQMQVEEYLNQPGKKLILFGTGVMARNFLRVWGGRYQPDFFVDNNSDLWEKERFGITVKKPEEILNVPEKERNVWICNRFYDQIGTQLEDMGITYKCYNDNYYPERI